MHPVLIEFGHNALYSYGFFISAAFILGMAWTMHEAALKGLDNRLVLGLGFYVLLGGMLGVRLTYVAINSHAFVDNPLDVITLWNGGMVFMGGALVAALFMFLFLLTKKQNILQWFDAAAPGVALGIFLGWLGCLAAGCGYGKPSDLPWSITFTHPHAIGPLFVSMHPTQVYQALAALVSFIILVLLRDRFSKHGQLAGLFIIIYSPARVMIDFFRGDIEAALFFLSVNQALGLAVAAAGLFLFIQPCRSAND